MKATQTSLHLFADCVWTKRLIIDPSNWLGKQLQTGEVKTVLERTKRKYWKQFEKEIVAATEREIVTTLERVGTDYIQALECIDRKSCDTD